MSDSYIIALKLKHAEEKLAYYAKMIPRAVGTEYLFNVQANMEKYSKLVEQYTDYLEVAAAETYMLNEAFAEIVDNFNS